MRLLIIITLLASISCVKEYLRVPESDTSIDDALVYYNQGNYQSALDLIRSYLNRYPSSYERDAALYLGSASAYKLKDYHQATKYAKEITHRYPHSEYITKAYLIHGLAEIKLGSLDEGITSLIKVIETSSNAKEIKQAGNRVDSILPTLPLPSLKNLHRNHLGRPVDEKILYQLAKRELEKKMYDQAYKDFTRYLELFPIGRHSDEVRKLLKVAGMGGSTGKIGLLIPLTGQFQDYGVEARDAFFHQFSDTDKIFIGDTKSDPIEALITAQRLVEHKVDIIIGPIFAVEALPVVGFLINSGIPLVLPTESDPRFNRLSKRIISLSNEAVSETEKIAEYAMKSLNLKRIAILYPKNRRGEYLARIFKKKVEEVGGEIAIAVSFPPDSLTLKYEILAIKRKRPDGMFLPVNPEQLVMISTQTPYHELHRIKILTVGTIVTNDVLRLGEEYVEGIYFARPDYKKHRYLDQPSGEIEKTPGFVEEKFTQAAKLVKSSLKDAQDREHLVDLLRRGSQFEEKVYTIKHGELKAVEE